MIPAGYGFDAVSQTGLRLGANNQGGTGVRPPADIRPDTNGAGDDRDRHGPRDRRALRVRGPRIEPSQRVPTSLPTGYPLLAPKPESIGRAAVNLWQAGAGEVHARWVLYNLL